MGREAKRAERPRYKVGDRVILKNTWAVQLDKNGLKATIAKVRLSSRGVLYDIDAERPTVRMSAIQDDLEDDK